LSSPDRVDADPSGGSTPRRFDIELLRVLAVTGVVLFHFGPGAILVPNGFLGVDVFFTISGFVITSQLVRRRLSYPEFLARRVRRLLPSAVLVIVVTYGVIVLSRNVLLVEGQRPVAIAALLYVSNFLFAHRALDYFAVTDGPSPFLHYWSLSVEEQFYLVWPLVVLAVAYAVRRRTGRLGRPLLLVTLVLTVASLVVAGLSMRVAPEQTFYLPWARAHQLLVGAAAAVLVHQLGAGEALRRRVPGPLLPVLRVGSLALLAALLVWPGLELHSPGPLSLLISLPVALIALTGTGADLLARIGGWWPLAWVARLSYVVYLWHWPVWLFVRDQLAGRRGWELMAVAGVVTLVLSVLTHLLVEQPARDGRWVRALPPLRAAALGLGCSVLAAATVAGVAAFAPLQPWQSSVRPQLSALADDKADVYARGCHIPRRVTEAVICVDGPAGAARTVLALGDSHAATWQPAWQALARSGGWRFVNLTKSACAPWDVPTREVGLPRYVQCEQWREHAYARIERERPDVVVVHGSVPWSKMLDAGSRPVADRAGALRAAVTATVTAVRRSGATVVVMLDTPASRRAQPVQHCLATAGDAAACDFPSAAGAEERAVVRGAATAAGAVIVDPYPVVCPESTCHVVQDGVVVYRDDDHLTRTYVLGRRDWVRSWLDPLLARRAAD
jgi:peptidoglycan/LPS O-acetylase OafA/YrhL